MELLDDDDMAKVFMVISTMILRSGKICPDCFLQGVEGEGNQGPAQARDGARGRGGPVDLHLVLADVDGPISV